MNKVIVFFARIIKTLIITSICLCFTSAYAEISTNKNHTRTHLQEPPYSQTRENRIGISFSGAPWSLGLLFDYDRLNAFPDSHWTIGGEFGFYGHEITIQPRALRWENIDMSGFYAGPKLYFSNNIYKPTQYTTFFGIGAEGGWAYRFPENFDVGVGIDLSLTSDGPWGSVKVSAGYLF